jgi:DNA-binding NtrC family response regulator
MVAHVRGTGVEMAKLLLIDDDPALRKLTATILQRAGYDVDTARDGEEGSSLLESGAYEVLITDLIMPNKEGIELIIEWRRRRPALQIIAMSGGGRHGIVDVLAAAEKLGARFTLHKPFAADDLLSAVAQCLPPAAG